MNVEATESLCPGQRLADHVWGVMVADEREQVAWTDVVVALASDYATFWARGQRRRDRTADRAGGDQPATHPARGVVTIAGHTNESAQGVVEVFVRWIFIW